MWQPLCPSCMPRGVWAHRARRDRGGGRVGVLWGCPAPVPTARCCWQLRHSHTGSVQPLPIRAALISPPCQAHPSAQPGKSSLGGAATMATTASHSHSPRGACGWTVTSLRVCTCLGACASTELGLCVFLEFSRCRESCGQLWFRAWVSLSCCPVSFLQQSLWLWLQPALTFPSASEAGLGLCFNINWH